MPESVLLPPTRRTPNGTSTRYSAGAAASINIASKRTSNALPKDPVAGAESRVSMGAIGSQLFPFLRA